MFGNRKTNLAMVNSHFIYKKNVSFLQVQSEEMSVIYAFVRKLSKEIRTNYQNELSLQKDFLNLRKNIFVFFTSLEEYGNLLDGRLINILGILKNIRVGYPDLFEKYCKPLVSELKVLQEHHRSENFIKQHIGKELGNIFSGDTIFITRFSNNSGEVKIGKTKFQIMTGAEFIRKSVFVENLIFIGTPSQFDSRFSRLFFAKKTYFVAYDFFENKIHKNKSFSVLSDDSTVSTVYDAVDIDSGYNGEIFEMEIGQISSSVSKEEITESYLSKNSKINVLDQQECKLVILKNNCHIFVPLNSKVRLVERNPILIKYSTLREINNGDHLLFRNHSGTELIVEVADVILGDKSLTYRQLQERWKTKLRNWIDKYGIQQLSRHFRSKGINGANEINLKNWASDTICPDSFEKLLYELKFTDEGIKKIHNASKKITSAHLKAGRKISNQLLAELDDEMLFEVEEKGYVTFGSDVFTGASFNIETVVEIHDETIVIHKKDALKLWRNT